MFHGHFTSNVKKLSKVRKVSPGLEDFHLVDSSEGSLYE